MEIYGYSIFDRVTGVFNSPFFTVNKAAAVRQFQYLMKNSQMVAQDCDLYAVCTFDTVTGAITSTYATFVCRYDADGEVSA